MSSKVYKTKNITVIQLQCLGLFDNCFKGDLTYFNTIFFWGLRVPCKTLSALQFTLKYDYLKLWLGK